MSDATTTAQATTAQPKSRRGRRIMIVVLVVLLLLLGLISYLLFRLIATPGGSRADVETGGLTWIRSIYGTNADIDGQFDRVQAAVPGPDGSIWITDGVKQSLMQFTPDGRFVRALRGPDDAPLFAPSRLDVDTNGDIYAVDTTSDEVRVISSNNAEAGSFNIPEPVSIDVSEDRIAVGSVAGVAILNKADKKPLQIIGSRGKGENQFDYVHGVQFGADGTLYAMDSFNNRLSAYNRDGKRLWIVKTGKPGNSAKLVNDKLSVGDQPEGDLKGKEALQLPLGITVDGAGRIVVIDMFECAIVVLDPSDGSLIAKYGVAGAEDGQFFYPTSISYDPQRDWFTVADNLNNRAQVVRIPGSSANLDVAAATRRALSGPLRACLVPFLLLILASIVWFVMRRARRKREQEAVREAVPFTEPDAGE